MSYEQLIERIQYAATATLVSALVLSLSYMLFEPVAGRAQASDTFTVSQTVSDAIAFAAAANDVAMSGTLSGLTGGTSYGTTSVRVTTNNSSGFNMTIEFSSTTAMRRSGITVPEIYNYLYSTGTASYPAGFTTAVANAQFGFSVNASNTADISDVFTGTAGVSCGTGAGSTFTLNDCWRGASSTDATAATELINTGAPTPASGSTSTIQFRVTIPGSPNPAVPNGTYVATATLTATDN